MRRLFRKESRPSLWDLYSGAEMSPYVAYPDFYPTPAPVDETSEIRRSRWQQFRCWTQRQFDLLFRRRRAVGC